MEGWPLQSLLDPCSYGSSPLCPKLVGDSRVIIYECSSYFPLRRLYISPSGQMATIWKITVRLGKVVDTLSSMKLQ